MTETPAPKFQTHTQPGTFASFQELWMRPRHPNGFAGFAENTYWEISANLSGFLDKKGE
jgi:hypothetical protein